MTYEQLLTAADQAGLTAKERPLQKHDGLICGNRIAIRKNIDTQAKKSCVLAEELGHHYTTTGNILEQTSDVMNQKQEYRARFYGYNLRAGLIGIINSYEARCRNFHEMADYLVLI